MICTPLNNTRCNRLRDAHKATAVVVVTVRLPRTKYRWRVTFDTSVSFRDGPLSRRTAERFRAALVGFRYIARHRTASGAVCKWAHLPSVLQRGVMKAVKEEWIQIKIHKQRLIRYTVRVAETTWNKRNLLAICPGRYSQVGICYNLIVYGIVYHLYFDLYS